MRKIGRIVLALGLMAASALPAMASPNGVWEFEGHDTRIQLELCGNGSQLCGKLVWLFDADYNNQYKKYLNTPVTTGMSATGNGKWKGKLRLLGYDMTGSITQQGENQMTISGCAFLVVCKTYKMFRYSE